jgi:hypothetical protein
MICCNTVLGIASSEPVELKRSLRRSHEYSFGDMANVQARAAFFEVTSVNTFDQPVDANSLYRYWGAHLVPGGVRFVVWAPNAREGMV